MFTVLEKRTVNESTKYHKVGEAATLAEAEAIRDAGSNRFVIDAEGYEVEVN